MITIKSEYELSLMRIAGRIVYDTHQYLKPYIKPGITTGELDKMAHDYIISRGAYPSCLNYEGYPKSICISVNEEVVHGIPGKRKLKNGDIVTLDICACYKGYHGDSAWSYPVGDISEAKAIKEVFGDHAFELNISSTKSMTGHLLGAAGAVESIASILAIKNGIVPPTINHEEGDNDENIDYNLNFTFNKAQKREVNVALSNTFGFGGHNACVIFKKYAE